jgi:NAD+ kinase
VSAGRAQTVTVLTHARPQETAVALRELASLAAANGTVLRLDPEETRKHGLEPGALPATELNAPVVPDADLCIALGGDGTILRALREYARTGVPVFAVNFGEIGFLATVDPEHLHDCFERALSGDYELLRLPAIELETNSGHHTAINDFSIQRKVGQRVAEISYALEGEELGSVRCDGLVVATPAGSTGYNLANGGPVMAWGVEGFVVSFIAPHSLTARALVVAPSDVLSVTNGSRHEGLEVAVDGRPVCELAAGAAVTARFVDDVAVLAQLPETSFYRRLREKFGRLSR